MCHPDETKHQPRSGTRRKNHPRASSSRATARARRTRVWSAARPPQNRHEALSSRTAGEANAYAEPRASHGLPRSGHPRGSQTAPRWHRQLHGSARADTGAARRRLCPKAARAGGGALREAPGEQTLRFQGPAGLRWAPSSRRASSCLTERSCEAAPRWRSRHRRHLPKRHAAGSAGTPPGTARSLSSPAAVAPPCRTVRRVSLAAGLDDPCHNAVPFPGCSQQMETRYTERGVFHRTVGRKDNL